VITIESPSVSLNDERAPVRTVLDYDHWFDAESKRDKIIHRVVEHHAKLGVIRNLVICAHGLPGSLQLGEGFNTVDAPLFSRWQGKVKKIWFRACLVARRDRFGHSMAREIARHAQCWVVASTELQTDNRGRLPYGQLDTYEGLVLSFGPDGRIHWSHRYPSTYQRSPDPNDWAFNRG